MSDNDFDTFRAAMSEEHGHLAFFSLSAWRQMAGLDLLDM